MLCLWATTFYFCFIQKQISCSDQMHFFTGVLWCLLSFTVHRMLISWVFLPHTSVYHYSAFVDLISSQPCLSSGSVPLSVVSSFPLSSFCALPQLCPSQSLCYVEGDKLHERWESSDSVFSGLYMMFPGFRVFLGGFRCKCFYFV